MSACAASTVGFKRCISGRAAASHNRSRSRCPVLCNAEAKKDSKGPGVLLCPCMCSASGVHRGIRACCLQTHLGYSAVRKHCNGDLIESVGMDLKAAWYGAEIFGKMIGGTKQPQASATSVEPITWDTALKEVRADFDNNYFVSGDADMSAYDPECEFADPFVSFNGVDRFKTNLSNFSKVTYAPQPAPCATALCPVHLSDVHNGNAPHSCPTPCAGAMSR